METFYLILGLISIALPLILFFLFRNKRKAKKRKVVAPTYSAPPLPNPTTTNTPLTTTTKKTKNGGWWITVLVGLLISSLIFFAVSYFQKPYTKENITNDNNDFSSSQSHSNTITSSYNKVIVTKDGYTLYMNPMKIHTRPQGKVKYTLVSNPSTWIIEDGPCDGNNCIDEDKWWKMPAGNYNITPVGSGSVEFRYYF